MIDLALMTGFRPPLGSQTAHFLTGLEPTRLRELYAQGFEVDFEGWWDPRSSIVVSSLAGLKESRAAKGSNGAVLSSGKALPTWLKPIAKPAVDTLRGDADASSLQEAVLRAISRQLSRMILLPLEEMDTSRPIIQYGVDSLLAVEYPHWLWSSLKVDVPFLSSTKDDMNLTVLAHDVVSKLPYVRNESI